MATFKLDPNIDISMTCFHGDVIHMKYDDLVRKLGEPHVTYMASKTQYEWFFSDESGRPVALYDWKEYGNRKPSEWHIGARDKSVSFAFLRWFQGGK